MKIRFRTKSVSFRLVPILLMLYSALIPLENVLSVSFGGSINKYIGLLVMGLIYIWCIQNENLRFRIPKQIFVFSLFTFCSMFWSINQNFQILSVMLNVVIFTLIVIKYPLTSDEKIWLITAIFAGGIVVSSMMLFGESFTMINTIDRDRMSIVIDGLMVDNNNLAVSLSICCIAGFSLTYKRKQALFIRICKILGIGLIAIAILRTGSRGGLLALTAGGLVFLFYANGGLKPRTIIIGLICILLGIYYIQNYMSESLASRFPIEEVITSGGTGRTTIWVNALQAYIDSNPIRWLVGYGFGSFPTLMSQVMGLGKAAHNDVVQILVETGIIGLILYFLMWFEIARYATKKKNATALALLAVVAVGSLSMEMLIKKMLWLVFLIVIIDKSEDFKLLKRNR